MGVFKTEAVNEQDCTICKRKKPFLIRFVRSDDALYVCEDCARLVLMLLRQAGMVA